MTLSAKNLQKREEGRWNDSVGLMYEKASIYGTPERWGIHSGGSLRSLWFIL